MIPTRLFWALVALGIPLALLGLIVPNGHWILVPYNLVLLLAFFASGRIAKKWNFIRIERNADGILSARTSNTVSLSISNSGPTPIALTLRDELPDGCFSQTNEVSLRINPEAGQTYSYELLPKERGLSEFPGTFIRYEAPLGLAMIQKQLDNRQPIRIYPNVKAVRKFELLKQKGFLNLMGIRKSRVKGLGTEFESLREYNEDDYRTIDWKASARHGKLVVRNFEQESNQSVIICLDTGRHMLGEVGGDTKLDHCLDSVVMLLNAAERAGDQVGLLVFNDIVQRYIVPKKGRTHVSSLLDTIHDLRAEPVQPDYTSALSYLASRWKKRSLVVLFTDAEDEEQASELSSALVQIARRHLIMVVRLADPHLKSLANQEMVSEASLFERAAAVWYLGDRRKAQARLSSYGFQSIEAEPEELSTALVKAYLRVKQLSLL